jgi:hypothetical protein
MDRFRSLPSPWSIVTDKNLQRCRSPEEQLDPLDKEIEQLHARATRLYAQQLNGDYDPEEKYPNPKLAGLLISTSYSSATASLNSRARVIVGRGRRVRYGRSCIARI